MAHFYGEVKGSRGKASRLGTKKSGIITAIKGWEVGVEVAGQYDEATGKDVFFVYRVKYKGGDKGYKQIATITDENINVYGGK